MMIFCYYCRGIVQHAQSENLNKGILFLPGACENIKLV